MDCKQRRFSWRSLISLTLIAWLAYGLVSCANMNDGASTKTILPEKGKLYTFESGQNGFNTKTYFYDTGTEVIAFDAQFTPALAKQSIAFLRSHTSNPITYLIITHPNPDKFNGMSVFQHLGAKVITSRQTADNMPGVQEYKKYYFVHIAQMFTEETYPPLSSPDIVFTNVYDLQLSNNRHIELRELHQPGISSNQTVAYLPELKALIVGDLVHYKAHAWLEGGIVNGKPVPTIAGWIADLKELQERYHTYPGVMVYGGRGQPAPLQTATETQIAYLQTAQVIVRTYIDQLGQKKSELLSSDKSAAYYAQLQQRFEAQFPDYQLGYLIGYGIYGLVQSILQQEGVH